jgi:predicted Zn-dependent protease
MMPGIWNDAGGDTLANSLDFQQSLLNRARTLWRAGLTREAREAIQKLLGTPKLPLALKCEALRMAADVAVESEKYHAARKALEDVIKLTPRVAENYHRLATVIDMAGTRRLRQAIEAVHSACELEPENAEYWAFHGILCVRRGLRKTGLLSLRRAMKLAPTECAVLQEVCAGLVALGRREEAKVRLMRARFRKPKDASLTQLWNRLRFDEAATKQQAKRGTPTTLSFPTLAPGAKRADGKSPLAMPHLNTGSAPRIKRK